MLKPLTTKQLRKLLTYISMNPEIIIKVDEGIELAATAPARYFRENQTELDAFWITEALQVTPELAFRVGLGKTGQVVEIPETATVRSGF